MAKIDKIYKEGILEILDKGYTYEDPNRKGVKRKEIPSFTLRHELKDGFPALTSRKVFFKGAVEELLFFLSGNTDIRKLWERGVHFWDKDWANFHNIKEDEIEAYKTHRYTLREAGLPKGFNMGKIYPYQYRRFGGEVDQIQNLIDTMIKNPMSTSLIVNAWNPAELKDMALPPCHYGFQVVCRPLNSVERQSLSIWNYTREATKEELDDEGIPKYGFELHWQQRSTDYYLGTSINVMYYALLAHLLGEITGLLPIAIQGDLKNVHLYDNQKEAAKEFYNRKEHPRSEVKIELNTDSKNIDDVIKNVKFELVDYNSEPNIKVPMLAYDKGKK